MKRLIPLLLPVIEFAVSFAVPWKDYVKAVCWSRNPPACSFEFSPSLVFFLAVALSFIALAVLALWRDWKATAVLSTSAGTVVLIGTALLTIQGEIALVTVLLLSPILQLGFGKIAGIRTEKVEETLWAVSTVLSFLAVWVVVRMGLAVSV